MRHNTTTADLRQQLAADVPGVPTEPLADALAASAAQLQPSPEFAARLRASLLSSSSSVPSPITFMSKLSYSLAGFAASIVVVGGAAVAYQSYLSPRGGADTPAALLASTGRVEILPVASNAFGSLSGVTLSNSQGGQGGGTNAVANVAAQAPAAARTMMASDAAAPAVAEGAAVDAAATTKVAPATDDMMRIMPYPYEWTINQYDYTGTLPLPTEAQLEVLRRVRPGSGNAGSDDIWSRFSFGVLDLNSFSGKTLESITISQEVPGGYVISANAVEGTVDIYQNWRYSNDPISKCTTPECYEQNRIKESDLLSDEAVIAIAQAFVAEHGISLDSYGKPVVDRQWRVAYEAASTEERTSFYLPETMSVVYPLTINDTPVYDSWGNPVGINVSVNIRTKAVSNVWGLRTQNYESSLYDTVKSEEAVRNAIKHGSLDAYTWSTPTTPEGAKVVTTALTEASRVYVQSYLNNTDGTQGQEVLLPALYLPVPANNEQPYGQRAVVVPLVQQPYDQAEQNRNNQPVPMPMPRPMIDPAASTEPAATEPATDTTTTDAKPSAKRSPDSPADPLVDIIPGQVQPGAPASNGNTGIVPPAARSSQLPGVVA